MAHLSGLETIAGREIVVLYGGCQADQIAQIMNRVPAVAERFAFVPVLNHAPLGEAIPPPPRSVERAALVWEQHDERETIGVREAMRARIPDGCPVVTFPACIFMSLWPFAWMDPRNVAEPGFPFGRYPWGDRVGHAVSKLGLGEGEILPRYMELSRAQMPDVERLVARDFDVQNRRDERSDVTMSDFIRDRFRDTYLFWTWGHPSSLLVGEIARRLYRASAGVLGPMTGAAEMQLAEAIEQLPGTGNEQLPIHPDVIERLALTFCSPESTYNWMGKRWSFGEYMRRYIAYDVDW